MKGGFYFHEKVEEKCEKSIFKNQRLRLKYHYHLAGLHYRMAMGVNVSS
jgi:hypothetical protein